MKLTLSGLPGSGTTTIATLLSGKLGIEVISAGAMFRQLAADKNFKLDQFSKMAEAEAEFDRWVDAKQQEEAAKRDNVIVEGRLSGHLIQDADLRIWLKAPAEIRARRIAAREHIAYKAALSGMRVRERSERARYMSYYEIDLKDLTVYDLIIDTSRWNEDATVGIITIAVAMRIAMQRMEEQEKRRSEEKREEIRRRKHRTGIELMADAFRW